jgi:hypothetical protein
VIAYTAFLPPACAPLSARKQLVEEGFAAVLSRKQRATPAVPRIFDGEKEAKLIALACSKPPKGCGRLGLAAFWRTRLWNSVSSRAPAIQRSAARSKKTSQTASPAVLGDPAKVQH